MVLAIAILVYGTVFPQEQAQRRTTKLMGSRFDITIVAPDETAANHYIDMAIEEISRIEKLISSWNPSSQTSEINKNAGISPVKVDQELIDLIERCITVSKITDGAFDITYASMDKVWKYDGSMAQMPSKEAIKNSVAKIGYQNIVLDKKAQTVFLKLEGMKIGFGAIGKGYAADKVRSMLKAEGVKAGIINASGDLTTWGKQADGKDWMVGITNPLNKDNIFSWFPVVNAAVATSGNYEKYVTFNGVKYSHIIDPRTGYPSTGIQSVTIFALSAELCDALATSVFITGTETGLNMIDQIKGVECIIIDDQNNIHTSQNIELNKTQ
ncbi:MULTISPECIES: FAD:protein FMN transferase [unclassified Arenibacter]|uniref:FAD:protein FMN transferase n=1 Tax=unclassified Arenibacter TaxID=2615047 RepID=UPI000E343CF8|nr:MULTISPECIES: FAD:protein FMN transferase [unclassified Arenibacter]MCM4162189.1 thiamine biosynthesis protein ApbE [Arenibacter sp. A80]RFT57801.1 FAD:protein FMN transferase [Arenibacter sp. P308M17]